jgi:hypothetical protein
LVIEKRDRLNFMQQLEIRQTNLANAAAAERVPEARYSYYRRCQLFRRNGDQCKAPAEKGEAICHAHAAQQAMALRRGRERRAVLAEAVAQMRRQGRPECEMADLLTDFKGIQVTLAVVSRALMHGRIDCKTAGRLLVHLQTMSKLLWLYHRSQRGKQQEKALTTKDTKEHEGLPQVCADERRLKTVEGSLETGAVPLNLVRIQPGLRVAQTALTSAIARDIDGEDSRVALAKVRTFPESRRGCRDGPWRQGQQRQQARAA